MYIFRVALQLIYSFLSFSLQRIWTSYVLLYLFNQIVNLLNFSIWSVLMSKWWIPTSFYHLSTFYFIAFSLLASKDDSLISAMDYIFGWFIVLKLKTRSQLLKLLIHSDIFTQNFNRAAARYFCNSIVTLCHHLLYSLNFN